MNFIAIDFETANSIRSSICSMGVAIVENGKLVGSEHFLVKPTPNHYDSYNTFLHGIDDSHTKKEKTFKQQWKSFQKYFHNQTIVAHNASFDCSVLRFTLDSAKLIYPDLDYHCTYRLSQELLPLDSFKLDDVSRHFKIKLKHHNAESDAKASALIAIRLCEKHKVNSLEELSTSIGFKVGKIISETKTYRPFSKK
jgi:DNA polymerase-3 subunit epsilon